MVERWTENPCVSGSIPLLDIIFFFIMPLFFHSDLGAQFLISIAYISPYYLLTQFIYPFHKQLNQKSSKVLENFLSSNINLKHSLILKIVICLKLMFVFIVVIFLAYYGNLYIISEEAQFYDNHIFYCLEMLLETLTPEW